LLSIIIPTLNESKTGCLSNILSAYEGLQGCEVICVDGGSTDNTVQTINQFETRLVTTNIDSRAGRLNAGIQLAQYNMVLLHHPRSVIDVKGIVSLIDQANTLTWGGFTQQFDLAHPLLVFTSWYSNFIRGDKRGIYYLDHCLFVQKQLLLDVGLVPDLDIFEDTALCLRLNKKVKGIRLPFVSLTSAIRFKTQGIYRQAFKNQYLKWQYYLKRSDKQMNKLYEKGVELNTKYNDKP
jgi:glycosyltransferase involved in cell wall biosynthesis